ncbi:MAG: 3-isopropylmalate dehydrogenase [Bacteroidetes bacterium]|nr:MAG: 3-isopropylmalate dehydrogenase [Bacteroidota bacterium]
MKNYSIAVLPGDGIGPEVVAQALKVLRAIEKRFSLRFGLHESLIGAAAIDACGDPLPEPTLAGCISSDAVLLGAVGHPKYAQAEIRPEQGLLQLRKELGLYANMRPVKTWPQLAEQSPLKNELLAGVDLVVVRELTGGLYYGASGRSAGCESAYDTCVYSRQEIERITRCAFQLARARRNKITLVDKANVLETSRFWRSIVHEIAPQFPDVTLDCMYVDNAAMQLIREPRRFDVILTENMFGDILSDESSVLAGSLGLLPSASTGEHAGLFEPVHGSYPEAAGKNSANPVASILSVAMMLDYLGEPDAAAAVREAVDWSVAGGMVTCELNPEKFLSCSRLGDLLALRINEKEDLETGPLLFSDQDALL